MPRFFRDPRDNSCNTPRNEEPIGEGNNARHGGGSQAEAVDQDRATRRPACGTSQSHGPARQRCVPRRGTRPRAPRLLVCRMLHHIPRALPRPVFAKLSDWFAIALRLFSLTSEIIPRSTHPTRSALLPDGRDMHPEPEELHGRVHRQQRRGSAPPRARRMVGVAGEASRRRAPSTSRGWTKQRGRFHDAISDDAAAAARERPSGVLRTVLRPPRDDRDGAVPGHAQRPRAPEPQGTSLTAAGSLCASCVSADDIIRRRLHGQRQDVLVVIPGCIQRAVADVRFLPPERPDEHGERVRDGVGVTTGR